MAKKTTKEQPVKRAADPRVKGLHGSVSEESISHTLEYNYMPYAMSVIVSRAIPEIDGFKPSHRKLLYTMYKMGLLNGGKVKSANIVGQTMQYNPHGDAAIYETMVRLSKGNEALLHPYIESKGNFGKVYSRDMAYAAPRYTEAKLDPICKELFKDIDFDTVDMVDNYDSTKKEPTLLPTTYPNILVASNMGIAVGMASNICGFSLREVCETTAALLKNPDADLMTTLPAPDFSTGGEILYDAGDMQRVYETGRGPIKLRSRWRYIKEDNLIEIFEIPYSTTIEAILDKVRELMKNGSLKEISDMRDESDLNGLKLTIDLRRGVDPDKLMQKLFKSTPLQDSFGCNFNVLIAGRPQVLGVRDILLEWIAWRTECVKRKLFYQKSQKEDALHLLLGLKRILLDIDQAIAIIRETESDSEVIPNLMIGFGIDQVQAEYIAEIKLRNINKEYLLKRIEEADRLTAEIDDLNKTLSSSTRLRNLMIRELEEVSKKYGRERKSVIVYDYSADESAVEEAAPDYPVTVFLSREGYYKKITPQSLRMSGEQLYKEGDSLLYTAETTNNSELLLFTNQQQVFKLKGNEFKDSKASVLGTYLPGEFGMEPGEQIIAAIAPGNYEGFLIFAFENGKAARIPLSAYQTKSNRRKLSGAYSDKSPLVGLLLLDSEQELVLSSSDNRTLIISTAQLAPKATRSSQGVQVMTLKKKAVLTRLAAFNQTAIANAQRYRARTIPAAGAVLKAEAAGDVQMTFGV